MKKHFLHLLPLGTTAALIPLCFGSCAVKYVEWYYNDGPYIPTIDYFPETTFNTPDEAFSAYIKDVESYNDIFIQDYIYYFSSQMYPSNNFGAHTYIKINVSQVNTKNNTISFRLQTSEDINIEGSEYIKYEWVCENFPFTFIKGPNVPTIGLYEKVYLIDKSISWKVQCKSYQNDDMVDTFTLKSDDSVEEKQRHVTSIKTLSYSSYYFSKIKIKFPES